MATNIQPPKDPLELLNQWLQEALRKGFYEPWAMVLSTSLRDEVFSRMVLLKKIQKETLFFYSNYESQKALQISQNPRAALNFYWDQLGRQVCLRGGVERSSRKASEDYWKSRSRASQVSQFLSHQSQSIPEGVSLKELHGELANKFQNQEIPCPENWGGYEFKPYAIEFWLEGKDRLHQRWSYKRDPQLKNPNSENLNPWVLTLLYP